MDARRPVGQDAPKKLYAGGHARILWHYAVAATVEAFEVWRTEAGGLELRARDIVLDAFRMRQAPLVFEVRIGPRRQRWAVTQPEQAGARLTAVLQRMTVTGKVID